MNTPSVVKLARGQIIKTDQDIVGVYWDRCRHSKGEDMHYVIMPDAFDEPRIMEMVGRRFKPFFPHGGFDK